jgi:hypothetical protein
MQIIQISHLLLELQYPWNICSREQRNEVASTDTFTQQQTESALDTFAKGVAFLSSHSKPNTTLIPDDEVENREYSNEFISKKISSYSDMNIKIIEDFAASVSPDHKSESQKTQNGY